MLYRLKLFVYRLFGNTRTISKRADIKKSVLHDFVNIARGAYVISSEVGDYTSVGRNSSIINCAIGKFCSVSWNVTVGATGHPFDHLTTHAFPYIKQFGFALQDKKIIKTTIVGNDVWIGANVVVMPGLKIGNGAIIGAGAVVTKDIPPYAVCAGVPAKVLKFRFSNQWIEKLESLKWWEWEKDIIAENIGYFNKPLQEKDLDTLLKIKNEQKHR